MTGCKTIIDLPLTKGTKKSSIIDEQGRLFSSISFEKVNKEILAKKKRREKIIMLTAYDYPLASILDEAGVDIVLVGDSLANVVLGLTWTKEVGMNEMLHHAKAVRRAVKNALLVGDMPYESYQPHPSDAVKNAKRFMEEAGCDAVKLEWFDGCLKVAREIIQAGIPVMGHVGLTPQRAEELGGLKVQGKDAISAQKIIKHAEALEKGGCFSLVLECIPSEVAKIITQKIKIPTIGIGAGVHCDGQVLVTHDLLGLTSGDIHPKFVKRYANLKDTISQAVLKFKEEVSQGVYPDSPYVYSMDEKEKSKLTIKNP